MAAVASFRGMGTTVAGLLLYREPGDLVQSRRQPRLSPSRGRLEQLSVDHVPPGARSGIITQSLGGGLRIHADLASHRSRGPGITARWLLCSDGLSDMLDLDEIEHAMAATDEEAVRALFLQAMDAGGDDNISIIVMSVEAGAAASIAPGAT